MTGVGVADDPGIPPLLGLAALLLVGGVVAQALEVSLQEADARAVAAASAVTAVLTPVVYATTPEETATQLGVDLDKLVSDPNSKTGLVYRPEGSKTEQDEVGIADAVAEREGLSC